MANSSKKYFGFALADSMFQGNCDIRRRTLTADEVREMTEAGELTPCLNPSHQATIDAMRSRFGIDVAIPETPPRVSLGIGDSVVVMGVRGLPRLTDRHEYTEEEIASATFSFSEYIVTPSPAEQEDGVIEAVFRRLASPRPTQLVWGTTCTGERIEASGFALFDDGYKEVLVEGRDHLTGNDNEYYYEISSYARCTVSGVETPLKEVLARRHTWSFVKKEEIFLM